MDDEKIKEKLAFENEIIQCSVPMCCTRGPRNTMFSLPTGGVHRELWKARVYRPYKEDWTQVRVCLEHFSPKDIFTFNGQKRYIDNAVPNKRIPSDIYRLSYFMSLCCPARVCLGDKGIKNYEQAANQEMNKQEMDVDAIPSSSTDAIITPSTSADQVTTTTPTPPKKLKTRKRCCICHVYIKRGKCAALKTADGEWTVTGKKTLYFIHSLQKYKPISSVLCRKCHGEVKKLFSDVVVTQANFLTTVNTFVTEKVMHGCVICGKRWSNNIRVRRLRHFEKHFLSYKIKDDDEVLFGKPTRVELPEKLEKIIAASNYISTCCACGYQPKKGSNVYSIFRNDLTLSYQGVKFFCIIYAPEYAQSNWYCEYCHGKFSDLLQRIFKLNSLFVLTCRRPGKQTLREAKKKGCMKKGCRYKIKGIRKFAMHLFDHLI